VSGDVAVDSASTDIAAGSTSGDVDVRTDPSAPRSIDASTTSGDVHVSRDG
jgi:hypothetical protein